MKTFHHGGRFGDLFYALWTMRELGGGNLIISDYHKGNWSLDMAWTLNTFLLYQPFIDNVDFLPYDELPKIDYDLHEAEDDFNPDAFPECPEARDQWPGNINIAKRYAVHFGLTYRPGEKWLQAPKGTESEVNIHAPIHRLVRGSSDWGRICIDLRRSKLTAIFIGGKYSGDWLETAGDLQSTKVFIGCVSGVHALAEGLGKTRFVEQAPDCFNVSVLPPSQCINGWSNDKVIEEVRKLL